MSRYRDDDYDDRGPRGRRERSSSYRDEDDYRRGRDEGGREEYGRDRYGAPIDYRADYLNRGGYDARDERISRERGFGGRRPERHFDEREYERPREPRPEVRRGASRSHVRCRDIMTRDVTVATRETTLQEVAAMMRDEDTGVIPVVERVGATVETARTQNTNAVAAAMAAGGGEHPVMPQSADGGVSSGAPDAGRNARAGGNGRLVGLITDRDIVIRAIADGRDPRATRAEEIMTDDVYTAQPNDRVIDVIRTMGDKQVRRIPVVDNEGNLRGIISMADVALETEEDRELGNALEEISSGSSFWSKIFG